MAERESGGESGLFKLRISDWLFEGLVLLLYGLILKGMDELYSLAIEKKRE